MKSSPSHLSTPHYRVCNYCEAMCGVRVSYDPDAETDETRIKVQPDREDPFSRGSMCPKASALGPLHYDPNKLRSPVKKVDGEWQEISWREAYATVSEKVIAIRDQYGADAIGSYLGNPIVHNLGMMLFVKTLTGAIGSKNVFSATSMDQLPHHFAAHFMFGHEFRIPVPDIDRTDYMIIMGANPLASNGSIMTSAGVTKRLRNIEDRGGQFIVIDPRRTETAKIASRHFHIQPATDVFFLLAFAHVLFRDKAIRLGRLQSHIRDFDKLEALVEPFPPEAVAQITGIDADILEQLVCDYLDHERAVLYGRMGLCSQPYGGLNHWLINTINILSGHFDIPGGMMFPKPAIELVRDRNQREIFGRWQSRVRGLKEFAGELPVSAMAEELLTRGEGQVRAFMTVCGNPVLSSPAGHRLDAALENVDFMFSIDNYINETTRHADLILPTPSGLEIDHYDFIFNTISVSNNAKFSEALFDVDDNRPFDWQVLKELAKRIAPKGLSLVDRWATPRRIVDWGLKLGAYGRLSHPRRWFSGLSLQKVIDSKHGINLGPLKPRVPEGLITTDRKIHLAPAVFLKHLKEVTAQFPEQQRLARQTRLAGEFRYIGRRNVSTNNSWMHQVKKLSRSKQVRCTAMMHPDDARALNIFDGEDVKVKSRIGEIMIPVEVTDTIKQGVLSIPRGFGHNKPGTRVPFATAKAGVSVNDITDHLRVDNLTGNAAFSGLPVKVEKISSHTRSATRSGKPLHVIYGSQSGNAEMIALDLTKTASEHDLLGRAESMDEVDIETLNQSERILIIVSTFGEGDMPDNAEALWRKLDSEQAPRFDNCYFSVLGLGDRSYANFCRSGNRWDSRMQALGATRLLPLVECDVDYIDSFEDWQNSVLSHASEVGDQNIITEQVETSIGTKIRRYNRQNPMQAKLKAKRLLNELGSTKETMHYELMLTDDAVRYREGDALYVIPENNTKLVDELLDELHLSGNEMRNNFEKPLRQSLIEDLEIRIPSVETLKLLGAEVSWGDDLVDLLKMHPLAESQVDTLIASLKPMVSRAYSIASSPGATPRQIDLTVATLRYERHQRLHQGAGSVFLADNFSIGDRINCYLVPNKFFSLPDDDTVPVIMVGPGTGIAPFRGFLLERNARQASGDNWLFFGDRQSETDFLYRQELYELLESGCLNRLDLAFSRDQGDKVYVQDRMHEHAEILFEWLERGAYFFVCGDADRMARDVEIALLKIIEQQGGLSAAEASDYVERMREQKRYQRDVY